MKYPVKNTLIVSSVFAIFLGGCNSDKNSGSQNLPASTETDPTAQTTAQPTATDALAGTLDTAESAHLVFMREEEKLARDVYMTLSNLYPYSKVFVNIGEGSEQTHTDMVRDQLEAYDIADPDPQTNALPASIGIYTGEEFGRYFTEKYAYLTEWGSRSELDALYVGAFIEELDMHDIIECPAYIVEQDNGISECGMGYTDEMPLLNSYSALIDGSKNHLRAFVGRIETIIGEGNYVAQVISQDEVNEILGR